MDPSWNKAYLILSALPETLPIKRKHHHMRYPDIGLRISVRMKCEDEPQCGIYGAKTCYKDYIAEYCGHGQSKTAFILNGATGDPFNGKILKVAVAEDKEPDVLGQMEARSPGNVVKILYNAHGTDGQRWYWCWITDRTIPVDQLFKPDIPLDINKERCVLGVLLCAAKCAQAGLRLSDCAFFNFGVCADAADQHTIVAIDAGSYGLQDPETGWPKTKATFTKHVVENVWKKAGAENVNVSHIRKLWGYQHTLKDGLQVLQREWNQRPYVSEQQQTALQIEQQVIGEVLRERTNLMGSASFKFINAIVRHFQAEAGWNQAIGTEIFEAAEKTRRELNQSEWNNCEELLSRLLIKGPPWNWEFRTPEEFSEGMEGWRQIKKFRDREFPQRGEISEGEAWKAVYRFANEFWKSDLKRYQDTTKNRRKTYNNLLHKRMFHKLAVVAIMQADLPMPGTDTNSHGGINIPDQKYATEMGRWLTCFARLVREHRDKKEYQESYQSTPQITGEKWNPWRSACDHSTSWLHSRTETATSSQESNYHGHGWNSQRWQWPDATSNHQDHRWTSERMRW